MMVDQETAAFVVAGVNEMQRIATATEELARKGLYDVGIVPNEGQTARDLLYALDGLSQAELAEFMRRNGITVPANRAERRVRRHK
ncbi:hypothetical protein [Paraburkholderia sp. GAS348]|uniref:hypothetical protein n=1 Tax=Paraburkholderia sp. GAS348 TaxID=3035132 RepID=UPI003D1A47A8